MSKPWINIAILATAVLALAGCYHESDHEYISLVESMETIERGRSKLDGVRDDAKLPIAYMLSREHYTLFATVDTESVLPSVVFEVEGADFLTSDLEGDHIVCMAQFTKMRPSEAKKREFPEGALRLSWQPIGFGYADCDPPPRSSIETESLRIYVVRKSDNSIKYLEELKFEIIRNGTYREYDSL